MGVKRIVIGLCLLLYCTINAQQDSILPNDYIETYPNKISTSLAYVNTSNSFLVRDHNFGINYRLTPNRRDHIKVSALFRAIDASFSFTPRFLSENKDNEDTRLFNLNLRFYYKQWMQSIDIFDQKGFVADFQGTEVPFPGISSFKLGGSTAYIFNPNFSFRSITGHKEWQTKSAGSFIPRAYFYYSKFKLKQDGFNSDSYSYDFALSPSYYYNWVINRKFLLSGGVAPGFGFDHTIDEDTTITSALYELNLRGALAYNSNNYFGGISSNYIYLDHKAAGNTRFNDNIFYFQAYFGYRFNAPKKLIKTADDVNEKLQGN
ncbi:DUF4421 family protein [Mangrovimonas aestuarii]|uniref:DUF4421 family protein n=1 Tax=Mangrovimonas aestuarii TaxID=3018443 RepID=UPI002378248F|nr:DUF4421 family protein [Mangrovimonas aestuarii]